MDPELHLFVLWEKARGAEERILADLRRETNVRFVKEMRFPGDAEQAFRRFYGPALPDARRKVAFCGKGAFLVIIVEDPKPDYRTIDTGAWRLSYCNAHMVELKNRYRAWTNRHHRVHGTMNTREFDRDVRMLTGHTAAEWAKGVPDGELKITLSRDWAAVAGENPFTVENPLPGEGPALENAEVFLENKYINDRFTRGFCCGRPAVEKLSTKAVWSIGNEFRLNGRLYLAAPTVVPRPLVWRFTDDGRSASVVTERVEGPSLTDLLAKGVTESEADRFAADILTLAAALKETGILHRDLFSDNLLLGADGHLKAIDWQLAIDRKIYREDPWVERHWKFRYVVFGVNRELGLGVWNDFHALGKILAALPQTEAVRAAADKLASEAEAMTFAAPPDFITRIKLRFYALSLRLQMLLRGRKHRKYAQLERRWRTVTCQF